MALDDALSEQPRSLRAVAAQKVGQAAADELVPYDVFL